MNDAYDNAQADRDALQRHGWPKVYILNDTGLDYSGAAAHGELVKVVDGPVDVFHPDRVRGLIEERMAGFRPAVDYVILSGSALVAALAASFLTTFGTDDGGPLVKVLLFDAKRRQYFLRTVGLH